jgi:fatty-acyl-CoA synthase
MPPWVDGLTLGQVLRRTAEARGNAEAIVFPQAAYRQSWAEFDREVDRCAKGLLALGLQHGDHFGVWSTNWPEWVVLQFATARIGVVLVTINPAYRPAELAYALAQSDVRGLALIDRFKTSDYDAMLGQICTELSQAKAGRAKSSKFPKLEWLVRLRGVDHPCLMPWQELIAGGATISNAALAQREAQLHANDPINLQYTSGTTGHPKGALLTHRNLLLNAFYAGERQKITAADRICVPVPLYHCFGCVLGSTCAAAHGAAMIFPHETFNAEATLAAIEAERCTAVYGVPTMFIGMLEHPTYPQRNCKSLRTGIMAGAPCPIELMKRVTGEMGASELTIAYGQTEASPLITQTCTDDPLEKRVGTIGRALPDVEVKIVDPATGTTLPDDTSGELCCRGHNVMIGYYNNPEATAKAIDVDGWLHTGDLALRHPDGYYRITGRQKDMIIRGGENIAPREVEELLYTHPSIEDAQVIGVPDRKFGEEVAAYIRLRRDCELTEDEVRAFCKQTLAHFKVPRYVRFVQQFPTTVTGKIQKFKLREQAIDELGLTEVAKIDHA